MTNEQIERIFTYVPPDGAQALRYRQLRDLARGFALLIQQSCPESREKALAITNLQQAVMWANAAIAINESQMPAVPHG